METPLLWNLVTIVMMLGIIVGLAGPLTWAERRQSAMIQDRIGPNRAGFRLFGKSITVLGLMHPLADAIKMITKEDVINIRVDRLLFNLAPIISLVPALVTFAVVPFGPDIIFGDWVLPLQVARIDAGVLYIFAISSLAVFGVTLAGYASASRLAMMGGLRASAQMISYEVAMGLALMGLFLVYGTLEPYAMVLEQGDLLWGWLPAWGIFMQPVAFVLFLTAAIAENKRVPFDLAEGESEIVGYFVEYSGMKFGMFFMAEYIEVIVVAGLATTFFFGGWQVPYLVDVMKDGQIVAAAFEIPGGLRLEIAQWLGTLLRIGSFFVKLFFFLWLQLTIRWSLPRFRYDQVMDLGWKKLLPISILNMVVTAAVILALN